MLDDLDERVAAGFPDAERLGDRRDDQARVAERRQVDEGDAVGEPGAQVFGGGDRQPRLADTTRADQRQQPHVRPREPLAELAELAVAPDERRRLRGQ